MTLVVFRPLYAGEYTLKGEATDLILPVFSHMREALLQGEWPLWNKYQFQGLATSTLPCYWNPVYLFLSVLFPAPDHALNALYLILILLSGLGFYKFSSLFMKDDRIAFLGGLFYPLAGFFAVQSQYLGLITAAAWTPLLLYESIRYQKTAQPHHLSLMAIGFYLFATGTSLRMVWMVVALLCLQTFYTSATKSHSAKRYILPVATLMLAGFLVWKIYWDRWLNSAHSAVPVTVKSGSLQELNDLSSLILSKATATPIPLMGLNGPVHFHFFTGIIIFFLAILSFWHFRTWMDKIWGSLCLLFLVMAILFGCLERPAMEYSAMSGPGMVVVFQLLFTGSWLMLGLRGFEKLVTTPKPARIVFIAFFVIAGGMALFMFNVETTSKDSSLLLWYIQLDLLKSALFLLLAGISLWIRRDTLRFLILGVIIIAELGLSTYLNQDLNLYNEYPSSTFSREISYPEDKVQPVILSEPIGRYGDQGLEIESLHRNTGTLLKKLSRDGYWPWTSKLHQQSTHTKHWNDQLRYPLFYYSQDATLLAQPSYTNFDDPISITSNKDHHWSLSINTKFEKYLIFNQNYDKNWTATIDDLYIPISKTSTGMMRIPITRGLHRVSFIYQTDGLLNIFGVTMVVFVLMAFILAIKGHFPYLILITSFPVVFLYLMNLGTTNHATEYEKDRLELILDSSKFVMSFESHSSFWFVRPWQITTEESFDGYRAESLNQQSEYSATLQIPKEKLIDKKEVEYQFHLHSQEDVKTAVVLKTYNSNDDSYNIQYITSLNNEPWRTVKGRFSLSGLPGPLIKAEFYIWNYQKEDFLIDDIQVKLNP